MKRIIGLILIASLLMSSVLTGYAFDSSTLRDIGIMDVSEDNNFVLRHEFISSVMTIVGGDISGKNVFSDVFPEDSYYGAVLSAYEYGFISGGTANREFRPKDPVSYEEIAKILVMLLGYDRVVDKNNAWPMGYITMAQNIKLFEGLSIDAYDDWADEEAVSRIFLNMLEIPLMEADVYKSDNTYTYSVSENTIINRYMKLYVEEGVFQGFEITNTSSHAELSEDAAVIDGVIYHTGGKDLSGYIGCNVKVIYKLEGGKRTIVSVYVKKNVEAITINLDDIDKVSGNTISYRENKKISFNSGTAIVYNGKLMRNYSENIFKTHETVTVNGSSVNRRYMGTVKFITNGSSMCSTIIIDRCYNVFVGAVDSSKKIVYDADSSQKYTFDNEAIEKIKNKHGKILTDISQISANSVLSLKYNEDNTEFRGGYLSDNMITGEIKSIKSGTVKTVIISDKAYKLCDGVYSDIEIGLYADFYLDIFDNIFRVKKETSDSMKYGYFMGMIKETGLGGKHKIKMLKANGEIEIFETAEKIVLDGNRLEADTVMATLSEPQLIMYRTKADNSLNIIDSKASGGSGAATKNDMLNEILAKTDGLRYINVSNTLDNRIFVSDAIVFNVPGASATEKGDYYYSVSKGAEVFTNGINYNIAAYKSGEGMSPDVIVNYSDAVSVGGAAKTGVVAEVMKGTDSEENLTTVVDVYVSGNLENYTFRYDCEPARQAELKQGDVIRFKLGRLGEIDAFQIIYEYGSEAEFTDKVLSVNGDTITEQSKINYHGTHVFVNARVYDIEGTNLFLAKKADLSTATLSGTTPTLTARDISSASIYVYNSGNRTNPVQPGDASGIISYKNSETGYDRVILYAREGKPQFIYVIK